MLSPVCHEHKLKVKNCRNMTSAATYAIYVEKELVGKRVKSSKVRVVWQVAFENDLTVHQMEVKHSIVSGKRTFLVDQEEVSKKKSMFQGTSEHKTVVSGHEVCITVEDTFEGYVYDVMVDNISFHRMPRKTMADLERMRGASVVKDSFDSFTGKKAEKEKEQQEERLIDIDCWNAPVSVSKPSGTNPFDQEPESKGTAQPDPFAPLSQPLQVYEQVVNGQRLQVHVDPQTGKALYAVPMHAVVSQGTI